jgi:hypothetical protein
VADNQATTLKNARKIPNARIREDFINKCNDSRIEVEANLSPRMRQIFRRHFDGFSRAVYLLRYYSRVVREAGVESILIKEIMDSLSEVNQDLKEKIQVADRLLGKENVKAKIQKFEVLHVTIIDPVANHFLKIFVVAQELDDKLSALWLSCIIDDSQRTKALKEIESGLRSIQGKGRVISMGLRDRARAQRPGNEIRDNLIVSENEILTEPLAGIVANSNESPKPLAVKKAKRAVNAGTDVNTDEDGSDKPAEVDDTKVVEELTE